MLIPRFIVWMFAVAMMVLGAGVVSGQDYPNRVIRIITGGVGGGSDFTSRLIAQGISGALGQPVIVENRGPAILIGEFLSKAPPDGYGLALSGGSLWIGQLLQKMPYDMMKDSSPISLVATELSVLVVHPSVPVKSVRELIALAKAKPGALNYSSGGTGGSTHLAMELFKSMADVNMVRIPYKTGAAEYIDLVSGQVQLTFGPVAAVSQHVKSGKLRALAVTAAQPSVLAPGLPTVAASGLPGYEASGLTGIFAPAKTPAPIINRLNQEIVRVLNRADVKEKFFDVGVETVGSSPEQFAATLKSDFARWDKVIRDAGLKVN